MENRYRMLSDDRLRSEHDNRGRLDRTADEIGDNRKQLEDLKFMLGEKTRENADLNNEAGRNRVLLDEKHREVASLHAENNNQAARVNDLLAQQDSLRHETDCVKTQRAEMWREIQRLKESSDIKATEHAGQVAKQGSLDQEIERTNARIADTQRLIDIKTAEIRDKEGQLNSTQCELARTRDQIAHLSAECAALRRDNDRLAAENFDARKELESQEHRNSDLSISIRDAEARLKQKEDELYCSRRDVEAARCQNQQLRCDQTDLLNEKEALEKHASCLSAQNHDLTAELDRFCQQDEILRQQLDRRMRVQGL